MNVVAERCAEMLQSCEEILFEAGEEAYTYKSDLLQSSSVGMHFRHILEFFIELQNLQDDVLCYDRRNREKQLEDDLFYALELSSEIRNKLQSGLYGQGKLMLEWHFDNNQVVISSSIERELAFNLEHLVHHMAIIRIGLNIAVPKLDIPMNFGLANSTKRYRKENA